ncbi:uncharacterized protein [Dermacentor albipictus]|uniref:uncharacterized protein n=1 Tax=Dermacentor albipictus TaxID=60249 RepID=UPI0031FBDB2C
MGRLCGLYEEVIGRRPANNAQLPPPQRPPIPIIAELPGVSKGRSPTCALQQTAASLLHEDHGGNLQIYVDGSVMPDTGSSTAACVELPVAPVTIYCDSKAALLSLQRPERASLGVALLSTRLMALQEAGCSVSLHWLPAHVGIPGNEEADALAKRAHH